MSKYTKGNYFQVRERQWNVHPVWRGIGCFLLLLIPVMSFAGGRLLRQSNDVRGWFQVPQELIGSVNPGVSISESLYSLAQRVPEISPFLVSVANSLPRNIEIYYTELAFMVVFMVLGFGVLTVFYSAMYRTVGPSRYGPVDAPPVKRSPRRGLR